MAGAVKGLDKALKKTMQFKSQAHNKARRGLTKAGLFLKGESQKAVPVDSGNLRSSAFSFLRPEAMRVVVGYTAKYAFWVHENLEQKLKGQPRKASGAKKGRGWYWNPGGPKFLERPAKENERKIQQIIVTDMKV